MLGKIYLVHVQWWCYLFIFLSLGLRTQWKKKSNIVRKINKKNIAAFALKYFRVFQDRLDIMFFFKRKELKLISLCMHKFSSNYRTRPSRNFQPPKHCAKVLFFIKKKVVFCKVSEKKIIHSDDILMYALFWNT